MREEKTNASPPPPPCIQTLFLRMLPLNVSSTYAHQTSLGLRISVEPKQRTAESGQSESHDHRADDHETPPSGFVDQASGHRGHDHKRQSHRYRRQHLTRSCCVVVTVVVVARTKLAPPKPTSCTRSTKSFQPRLRLVVVVLTSSPTWWVGKS